MAESLKFSIWARWRIWAMSSTNGEEPPLKKKKPSTEPNSIPSLPDDLIVSCLARVSRLHYPILSLVSKSFESHIASPEIYQTRTLLNRTEKCLYVCLQFPSDLNPRWFTLCKKPNQTLTQKTTKKKKEKERSSGYVLARIRTLNSPTAEWTNLIAVGYNLYAIRATEESPPCSNIPYLDCRTHTWLEAPSMRIAHSSRLYLPGSCEISDYSLLKRIEVFNTETQTWNYPVPPQKWLSDFEFEKMEGKIYVKQTATRGLAHKPKDLTSEPVPLDMNNSNRVSYCMIEKVIYGYSSKSGFLWSESDVVGKLKGLEGLPKFARGGLMLVEYGGKMMVLWDKYVPARGGHKEKMIWCAEISFEKRNNGEEIWGKVEWVDAVLTVPKSYKFVYAIAATV